MTDKQLSVIDVAYLLRVSKDTVMRLIKSGRLKAVKVGRFWKIMRSDLSQFIDDCKTRGRDHVDSH